MNAKARDIFVPTQTTIEINESPTERLKVNDANQINFDTKRQIRCKVIEPKDLDLKDCDKLLLHIVSVLIFDAIKFQSNKND